MAYRLQLPETTRLHDVFHIGLLKHWSGDPPVTPAVVPPGFEGRLLPTPEKVVRAQLRRGQWQLLVKWRGLPDDAATWEALDDFKALYPDVQLKDELFVDARRDVMTGV